MMRRCRLYHITSPVAAAAAATLSAVAAPRPQQPSPGAQSASCCIGSSLGATVPLPVDAFGNYLYEPFRSQLMAAAQKRGLTQSVWLSIPQCAEKQVDIVATAEPIETTLSSAGGGGSEAMHGSDDATTTTRSVSFVNIADVTMPHNVDVRCIFRANCQAMRTVTGGRFSRSWCSALAAAAVVSGFRSSCWVAADEAAFLGWTPKPNAAPCSVSRHHGGHLQLFNVEDIVEDIDFATYFYTNRLQIANVVSGKRYSTLMTLQWRKFLREQGFAAGTEALGGRRPFDGTAVGGTANAFEHGNRETAVSIRKDAQPFVCMINNHIVQLFVAAQTTDPERAVARGLASKDCRAPMPPPHRRNKSGDTQEEASE